MFVVRGTIQEFLGFSPAELVFGHLVHGPFKFLSEQFLAKEFPRMSVLDYVSTVWEHLHKAWELARVHLAQSKESNSIIMFKLNYVQITIHNEIITMLIWPN